VALGRRALRHSCNNNAQQRTKKGVAIMGTGAGK
jgi:hypothetical protein